MGVRILVGVIAMLRATLVYGEVAAAESWQPRRPAWLRARPAPAPGEQPASRLATAA